MELYLRDDGGIVLSVPLEWLEETERLDEPGRCVCRPSAKCAYCLMREGEL